MRSDVVFASGLTAGVLVALSATLIAGQVTGLITFTANTPAKASEVNGNFAAVKTAVDDNDARITTVNGNFNTVSGTVSDHTARIAALEAKLAKFGTPSSFGPNAGNGVTCTLGEITITAASVTNGIPAQGQLLPIVNNQALFALLGTNFGGDGRTTFAVPDLRGLAPNGITYGICDVGVFPSQR